MGRVVFRRQTALTSARMAAGPEPLSTFRTSGGSPSSHPSETLRCQLNGVRRIGCLPCCLGKRWLIGWVAAQESASCPRYCETCVFNCEKSILPDWTERSRCAASVIVDCSFDNGLRLACFPYALLRLLNITLIVEGCRGKVGGRLAFMKPR
ncbi:hypothetical protein CKAH01_05077 [Colletotrichum kahawae]|uniref:Uncharacterized protein n=1 Tax=Colletotrichum kahawae TaxID=34407 RepID=A0AAD9YHA7_COLKA|nr:hypothetical protein CKAH01_05077 [Colletotrichum kahawae]